MQEVVVERRPGVLRKNLHPRTDRYPARTQVGSTIDPHQAVRAVSRTTQEAARAMVLEAAAKNPPASGKQCHGDGLTGKRLDRLTVEAENKPARIVYLLGWMWR